MNRSTKKQIKNLKNDTSVSTVSELEKPPNKGQNESSVKKTAQAGHVLT
jgi:hypothetical protein